MYVCGSKIWDNFPEDLHSLSMSKGQFRCGLETFVHLRETCVQSSIPTALQIRQNSLVCVVSGVAV